MKIDIKEDTVTSSMEKPPMGQLSNIYPNLLPDLQDPSAPDQSNLNMQTTKQFKDYEKSKTLSSPVGDSWSISYHDGRGACSAKGSFETDHRKYAKGFQ